LEARAGGGLITHENLTGDGSLVGARASTMLQDNGTSANDPPDQFSFTTPDENNEICTQQLPLLLFDVPQGQVRVE
jgi:hypothetical protein